MELRPGFLRGVLGLIAFGVAFAITYRSLALGGYYMVAAVSMLLMGLFLGAIRGALLATLFIIPAHFLLTWPVPPPSAQFGTIMLGLGVFLGAVPGVMVALGFVLKQLIGVLIAAVLVVPAYITFIVAFPFPAGAGPVNGAMLAFGGFGMAFGFLWGVGSVSPGATAHEGPTYYATLHAKPRPNIARETRKLAGEMLPKLRETFVPLIRPLLTALAVSVIIVGALVFVATNPIVPVSRAQTNIDSAAAHIVTGEKFVLFVLITVAVLGAVATLAVGLALLIRFANREVVEAKTLKPEPVDTGRLPGANLVTFILSWIGDIFQVLRRSVSR